MPRESRTGGIGRLKNCDQIVQVLPWTEVNDSVRQENRSATRERNQKVIGGSPENLENKGRK